MKFRTVDISECELEDLIRRSPENLESGVKYIDHQKSTERGPLDVLLVDSGRALVVAELKVIEDDSMLVQAIDYYDDVVRNLEGFCRAYKQHGIDPAQEPRLFLVAPSFSISLLKRVQWINIPISLFTYQCIELEEHKGERIAVYKEVSAPALPRKIEAYSLDDRFAWITDPKVRGLAERFLDQMKGWDGKKVLADATKNDISIKVSGRVVAYIYPRRKYFHAGTYDAEGKWVTIPVHTDADLQSVIPSVRACFDRVSSGKAA